MHTRNSLLVLALAACSSAPSAKPVESPKPKRFDVEVRGYFFQGFRGDTEALAVGMQKTEARLATHPDDAEALVWHGGGLAFQAGEAFRRGDRAAGQDLYTRGVAEVERARGLAPERVSILIPSGALYLSMSLFMPPGPNAKALLEKGVTDYEATLRLQGAGFAGLGSHARGQLLYGLADGHARLGDDAKARGYYQRLVREVPDSPLAPRAQGWLDGKPATDKVTCIGCHEG